MIRSIVATGFALLIATFAQAMTLATTAFVLRTASLR